MMISDHHKRAGWERATEKACLLPVGVQANTDTDTENSLALSSTRNTCTLRLCDPESPQGSQTWWKQEDQKFMSSSAVFEGSLDSIRPCQEH